MRIAVAPTVGFGVQVIKGTALASIIGFTELSKAGTMIVNATLPAIHRLCRRGADVLRAVLAPSQVQQDCLERKFHAALSPLTQVRKSFGEQRGPERGFGLSVEPRRGHRHHRQERLGQEYPAPLHQRAGVHRRRRHHRGGRRILRRHRAATARAAAQGGHDLPAVQPVSAPERGAQRDVVADDRQGCAGGLGARAGAS